MRSARRTVPQKLTSAKVIMLILWPDRLSTGDTTPSDARLLCDVRRRFGSGGNGGAIAARGEETMGDTKFHCIFMSTASFLTEGMCVCVISFFFSIKVSYFHFLVLF